MAQPQRKHKESAHSSKPILSTHSLEAFDTLALVSPQTIKNLNETVAESVEAITKRRAEIIQSGTESAMQFCQDLCFSSDSPDMHIAKHIQFGRIAFENAVANVNEVTKLVARAHVDIMGAVIVCFTFTFMDAFTLARRNSDTSREEPKQESA